MKTEVFKAVCPVEIGDKVIIPLKDPKATIDTAKPLEVMYIPEGTTVVFDSAAFPFGFNVQTITDIATIHYCKSGETQFIYELDSCGKYQPLKIKLPIKEFDEALRRRGQGPVSIPPLTPDGIAKKKILP